MDFFKELTLESSGAFVSFDPSPVSPSSPVLLEELLELELFCSIQPVMQITKKTRTSVLKNSFLDVIKEKILKIPF